MSLSLLLALQREKRNPSTNIISIPINQQKIKMVVFSFEYCINNEIEIKVYKCLKHVFKCNFPLTIYTKKMKLSKIAGDSKRNEICTNNIIVYCNNL